MVVLHESYLELPAESGIYVIVNITNDKKYVGSSKNMRTRIYYHVNFLQNNQHRNVHLQRAWNRINNRRNIKSGKFADQKWKTELDVVAACYGFPDLFNQIKR